MGPAGARVSVLGDLAAWLSEASTWSGEGGIPLRVLEHLRISAIALAAAAAVALPLGLYIGHTGRGEVVAVSVANLGRAIPSFAILALAFPIALELGLGLSDWPAIAALFLLGIPPILTNAYVAVKGVDPDTVEAARGMGLSGRDVLSSIEIPLAAPLIVAGIRISAVQIVATATLAAVVAGGGLGRFIVDGFAQGDDGMTLGGALLVAFLAIAIEIGFGLLERATTPRNERRGVFTTRTRRVDVADPGRPAGDALLGA
ncbi:MAG TPA: ABC transporter permease [Actinomycetota bacterium]|nr:ABC transporter permease [Actinomycetota bacterium]